MRGDIEGTVYTFLANLKHTVHSIRAQCNILVTCAFVPFPPLISATQTTHTHTHTHKQISHTHTHKPDYRFHTPTHTLTHTHTNRFQISHTHIHTRTHTQTHTQPGIPRELNIMVCGKTAVVIAHPPEVLLLLHRLASPPQDPRLQRLQMMPQSRRTYIVENVCVCVCVCVRVNV